MYRILIFIICMLFWRVPVFPAVVQGSVEKEIQKKSNRVVDSKTNQPITGAKITLPQERFQTYSKENGAFALDASITGQTVMSVEKPGYKPFSVTINEKSLSKPIVLGIEKSTPKDISIETQMFHLGDNSYSDLSANAREFQVQSIGPYYSKGFKIPNCSGCSLIIGSIIGIDTKMAKSMGQNRVVNAYSSPPEVYFNGNKIAEIQLNGDGQKIKIPSSLIRLNQLNEVTIKTGRNLTQTAYVDYDDIEFMNLSVEID